MMSPRPTMQMIADKAGVSKMTVSRSLANDHRITAATRDKVLRIAREMGYRKSPLVSALMTQIRSGINRERSLVLALVHNWPEKLELTPNLRIFRESAQLRARQLGFRLDTFALAEKGMSLSRQLQILHSRGIQGIIMEHIWEGPLVIREDLSEFAVVSIGQSVVEPVLHSVDSDQHREILMLWEYLRSLGYRRIALVNKEGSESMNSYRRRAAFLLVQQSVPARDRIPPLQGCQETVELLQALPAFLEKYRPEVVVSQHVDVYNQMVKDGHRVPGDIGFAHLGWHPGDPSFGGIDPNWKEKGIAAVNKVVELLNRNDLGIPETALMLTVPSLICAGRTLCYGEHVKRVVR